MVSLIVALTSECWSPHRWRNATTNYGTSRYFTSANNLSDDQMAIVEPLAIGAHATEELMLSLEKQ